MKKILVLFAIVSLSLFASIKGDYHFKQVASNVYVLFGPIDEPNEHNKALSNNPAIIVDKAGVIIIDPSGSQVAGEYVLNEIKKITDKPVISVFNTHIHGDHWLGNQAVIKHYPDVKIYAHPTMIKDIPVAGPMWVDIMMKLTKGEVEGLKVVGPNTKVGHEQIIKVGEQTFKIHNPTTKSHTNTDVMIEHLNSKTFFTADIVFYNRFGMFDGDSSMLGNIEAIEYAKNLNMKLYIPGHGEPKDLTKGYSDYLNYLRLLNTKVKQAYDDGMDSFEIKEKILADFKAYQSWVGFDAYFGKHIGKIYMEIEAADF